MPNNCKFTSSVASGTEPKEFRTTRNLEEYEYNVIFIHIKLYQNHDTTQDHTEDAGGCLRLVSGDVKSSSNLQAGLIWYKYNAV